MMVTWFSRRRRPAKRLPGAGRHRPTCERLEERCLLTTITEFGTGITAASNPLGITRGSDGNLWFTELANNALGRITPSGTVTEFSLAGLQAGSEPHDITGGPGGLLYFTEEGVGRIGSINPAAGSDAAILASLKQSAVVGAGAAASPFGITAGPDGNVWFTEVNGNNVGDVTPDLAALHEFPTPGAQPVGITTGPDGALWFTEGSGNKIGRITTAGTITNQFALTLAGSSPALITAGPDGNLWFTEGNANQIGRITPAGVLTEFPLGAGRTPRGITAGPDGNLWFTEVNGNRVGRITPAGVVTEYGTGITASSGPYEIVTGPDNNLWFTEIAGRVGRLTPDPFLSATGTPVTAIATVPFTGQVASFTDTNPNATPGSFTGTIDWGDGTPLDTTTGTVTAVSGQPGSFVVNGSHTYANAGNDTITVTITDTVLGASATAMSPATVVAFANSASLAVQQTSPSSATAGSNATFTITLTNSGPAASQDVTLTDAVPGGTTFVAATQLTGPAFNLSTPQVGGTGNVIADPVALNNGQSATFRLVFQAGATRSITNTATVTTATPNQNRNASTSKTIPVVIPVLVTLSPDTVADNSPADTVVGTLTVTLPVVLVGQFSPPAYGLPASEADNAAFALAATGAGELLVTQFRACSGDQASYPVSVHVDVGVGDTAASLVVTVVPGADPCLAGSGPPALESVQVVRGGKQGQAQELVLLFSAPLDPGSAANLGHYAVRFGFTGTGKKRKAITAPLLGATYDPVRRAVTLRLGKIKGPKYVGTLTVQDVLGLDGVLGNAAAVSVNLRPKPTRKH
jgi:uncharacterized repeat protein (TIGR01451 family)